MRKKICNPIHEQMIFPWKLKISNIQKWRRKKVKFKIIALVKTNYLLEKRKNIERICLKLKHFTNIILRFVRKAWQKKTRSNRTKYSLPLGACHADANFPISIYLFILLLSTDFPANVDERHLGANVWTDIIWWPEKAVTKIMFSSSIKCRQFLFSISLLNTFFWQNRHIWLIISKMIAQNDRIKDIQYFFQFRFLIIA